MDIIEKLLCGDEWNAFLDYKKSGGHLCAEEEKTLTEYIAERRYLEAAERINEGGFFSLPYAVKVNKGSSSKKRTVFVFPEEESYIQKFIAFQLLDYDYLFHPNLYSFRRNTGVKAAITNLVFHKGINSFYSYKLDISDYFNSIDSALLLPRLKEVLKDEKRLYALIENMLTEPYALSDGERIKIKKGILAGSPISGFLANLYLTELDGYFYKNGILYARYSDDVILFADSKENLNEYIDYINIYLKKCGLTVNENKVSITAPHEKWSFLGFSYCDGVIDISDISKTKLKKKMRRKARALLRWKNNKNAEPEWAVRAFIKHFNKKLYQNPVNNEITWCRWYFPIINTAGSLKEIDAYMQQCMRYIATGKQNRGQFAFKYEDMKSLGYKTLVNSFYEFKKNGKNKA